MPLPRAGKLGLNRAERCCVMGVPFPMETDPAIVALPLTL